jgi:5-(carboxyamino)imidazole ribonucleotide synthase
MSNAKRLSAPVPPGGTIGILGGGQLGRMLALAAARLGLKTHVFSEEPDAPAFQVCAAHTHASYRDETALKAFAAACDVITYEFENVPAETLALLAELKPANPNARALATAQERFEEKTFVSGLGIGTAPFEPVNSTSEAKRAFEKLGGGRGVLKTRRLGYDGKGQKIVASADEAAAAYEQFRGAPLLLEGFVEFAFEASVVAARDIDGTFAAYDPPLNEHANHILRRSIVPSPLSAAQINEAQGIARKIAEALDYVGVFCVELFVTKDDALLVNEIAPRVHNSGHWTMDACAVSQFEQHIRAVAGWPLGSPEPHSDAVMENIIGEEARDWHALLARGGSLHLYGKSEIRTGRKMGHITWLKSKGGAR